MHPMIKILIFIVLTLMSLHAVIRAETKKPFTIVHVFAMLLLAVFVAWAWYNIHWLLIFMVIILVLMYLFALVDVKKLVHGCLMNFRKDIIDKTEVEISRKEGR